MYSLKTNDTIRIGWRETPEAEPVMLYDSFPKNLATAFSASLNAFFHPLNQTSLTNFHQAGSKSFTIVGGCPESHRNVLAWMLACCDGKGVQGFQFVGKHAFYSCAVAYSSACLLEVPYLQGHLKERLQKIAARQVHSEDVELIFSDPSMSGPHPIKQLVCESIGYAIWEKRLAMRSRYEKLRRTEGFEEFDAGVGKVIEQLKANWKASPLYQGMIAQKKETAAKKKERYEKYQKRWEENRKRHEEYLKRRDENNRLYEERKARHEEMGKLRTAKSIAEQHSVDESAVHVRKDGYTLNTEGRVVNKGKNGHKKRIAISLADLQITDRNYRG